MIAPEFLYGASVGVLGVLAGLSLIGRADPAAKREREEKARARVHTNARVAAFVLAAELNEAMKRLPGRYWLKADSRLREVLILDDAQVPRPNRIRTVAFGMTDRPEFEDLTPEAQEIVAPMLDAHRAATLRGFAEWLETKRDKADSYPGSTTQARRDAFANAAAEARSLVAASQDALDDVNGRLA